MAATSYEGGHYQGDAISSSLLYESALHNFLGSLSAAVVSWALTTASASQQYISYTIDVVSSLDGYRWSVSRRFSQFEALEDWLSHQTPHSQRAPLPKKSFFGGGSKESEAAKRQPVLSTYVQSIFAQPHDLLTIYEVQTFFGLEVRLDQIFNQVVGAPLPVSYLPAAAPASAPVPGSLYLKLLEANQLAVLRSGKTPTTYAQLSIAKNLLSSLGKAKVPKPLVTETFQESFNPQWNVETFFFIKSQSTPVRIQIWENRHLSSNKLLGHVQIEIPRLQPYSLYDLWLPLKGASASTGGQIHLVTQFTPMTVHKQRKIKLANFRFQIDQTSFFPGQVVSGLLVLNMGQPLRARSITLTLLGYEETDWNETVQESYIDAQGQPQTRSRTVRHHQQIAILNERRMIWRLPPSTSDIPSGSYLWPFEFCLPARLPATFTSPHGWVRYALRATIHRPGLRLNQNLNQPLEILAPYVSLSPLPPIYGKCSQLPFRSSDQVVSIKAQLSHEIAIIGEPVRLGLTIENFTNHRVKDAHIRMTRTVVTTAYGHSRTDEQVEQLAHIREGFPIPPAHTQQFALDFVIPAGSMPSLPSDLSPLIEVSYSIAIECDISGFLTGKATAQIPIILSHRIPATVVALPPRVACVAQSQVETALDTGLGLPHFPPTTFTPVATGPVPEPLPEEETDDDFKPSNAQPLLSAPPPPVSVFFPSLFTEQSAYVPYQHHQ